eukprot:325989_1
MTSKEDTKSVKKQEETTHDKKSQSKSDEKTEESSPSSTTKKPSSSSTTLPIKKKADPYSSKTELIIDQVRQELESYFAPQNIQNDYNLRQKMTTDGYIDVDLLLGLKLMQDLVQDRDILIEAISKSKLLVMNSAH